MNARDLLLLDIAEAAGADVLTDDCTCREIHMVNLCPRCSAWERLDNALARLDETRGAAR